MNYWLFKTEPDEFSLDDLQREGVSRWDGIRNYQARNFLRDKVSAGDQVLVYHSQCRPTAVVGTARVVNAAYPDPAQFDPASPYHDAKATPDNPRWYCVDLEYLAHLARPVPLTTIKADEHLAEMVLVRQGRLSIQPVTPPEYQRVLALGESR